MKKYRTGQIRQNFWHFCGESLSIIRRCVPWVRFKIQEEEEEEEVSCKMQDTAGETPALPYEEVASSSHLKLNA